MLIHTCSEQFHTKGNWQGIHKLYEQIKYMKYR